MGLGDGAKSYFYWLLFQYSRSAFAIATRACVLLPHALIPLSADGSTLSARVHNPRPQQTAK